jgi:hypothetical protein
VGDTSLNGEQWNNPNSWNNPKKRDEGKKNARETLQRVNKKGARREASDGGCSWTNLCSERVNVGPCLQKEDVMV